MHVSQSPINSLLFNFVKAIACEDGVSLNCC